VFIESESATNLTPEETRRFDRQIRLPEVGESGQRQLKEARVLIVGLGGLGCPASLYLAAAGIGTLGLSEEDIVEASNLQRQILYTNADLGKTKLESASQRLRSASPWLQLEHYPKVDDNNVKEMIRSFDLVIDGTDNLAARYLLNDACAGLGKPLVMGSVQRFSGQVAVFDATSGPCYRCLYPAPPSP